MKNHNIAPFISIPVFAGFMACATTPQSIQKPTSVDLSPDETSKKYVISKEELNKLFPEHKRSKFLDDLLNGNLTQGLYHDPRDDNRLYALACNFNPDHEKAKEEAQKKAETMLAEHDCLGTSEGAKIYNPDFKTTLNKYHDEACIAETGTVICSTEIEIEKTKQRMESLLDAIDEIAKESDRLIEEAEKEIKYIDEITNQEE